jgi:hypothetical protein
MLVKADILEILGLLCQVFPERMFDKSNTLLHLYLPMLQRQFTSNKPEMSVCCCASARQPTCSSTIDLAHLCQRKCTGDRRRVEWSVVIARSL